MKIERVREVLSGQPTPDYWMEKAAAGWKLVAVEWAREAPAEEPESGRQREEVPFGLQVAGDCLHLEDNVTEKEILTVVLELITDDRPLSYVANELNGRGFRTRAGTPWGAESVFKLLPRLIDAAPQISSTSEWIERRRRARPVVRYTA
jgi:hypothetical protein